jgi:hypothetical protein
MKHIFWDLIFVFAMTGFFILALAYLKGCEGLRQGAAKK